MRDPTVISMAALRYVSALVELTAATLMLRYGRLQTAVSINAALGLFGPTLFAVVSTLGIVGLAQSGGVSLPKLAMVFLGVLLIIYGALS